MKLMKLVLMLIACAPLMGVAAEIQLVAAAQDKATIIINGERPRTLRTGQRTADGIQLLRADANGADFATADGKRRRILIGEIGRIASNGSVRAPAVAGQGARTSLQADSRGHFFANISINGIALRGMIDTGASGVVINGRQARSLGIDYRKGQRSYASTAAGYTEFYQVNLSEIRLGDIVLYSIAAAVIEGDFPQVPLLGNTLLNQLNMERQGDQLILSKRF